VDAVYEMARQCAVGDVETLVARRDTAFARYARLGVSQERVCAKLAIGGVDDFTLQHLELLVGMYNTLKSGEMSVDEAFPPVGPAPSAVPAGTPEGKRIKLGGDKAKGASAKPAETQARPATPAAAPAEQPVPPVDIVELHETLAQADTAWSRPGAALVIHGWSEQQRKEALHWARACTMDGPMADQANRPAHTVLAREPGAEG
jgi:hypothetical protein